jgi:phosphonate transport system substrate-binding protein
VLFITIPLFLQVSADEIKKPIRFAPVPMEGKKILHEQFFGLLGYLEESVGRPVVLINFDDYSELLEAFRNDEIDLAYLGPLPYALLAKSDDGVEPLACFREADGLSSYTCSLVAMGGRQFDLAHAQGLHIGLTQPFSTCGYLAVSQMLESSGRRLEEPGIRFSFAGSHTEAALGVVRGEYDLAGVKTTIAERYRHLDLRVLNVSSPFPGFGVYANRRQLSASDIERLREVLLSLEPATNEADRERMKSWGSGLRNGAEAPSNCDYQGVLDAVAGLPGLLEASP